MHRDNYLNLAKSTVLDLAAGLLAGEDDEPNTEYTRGVVELTADLLGISDKEALEVVLRALR